MADLHPGEITALLGRVRDGDRVARDELLPLVYGDLEAIARGYVHPAASLEPRGLVHELYLKLVDASLEAENRKHFFVIAALAMRQILADRARRKYAVKRGKGAVRVTLSGIADDERGRELDALSVDLALDKLEAMSPRQARIVELRWLLGLSVAETADALGLSERTIHAEWRLARAWLNRELGQTA